MSGKKFRGLAWSPEGRAAKRERVAQRVGNKNISTEMAEKVRRERARAQAEEERRKKAPSPGAYKPTPGSWGDINRYSPVRTTDGSLLGESLPEVTVSGQRGGNRYAGSSRRVGQNAVKPSTQKQPQKSNAESRSSLKNTPATSKKTPTEHVIKKGETLGSIARKYGLDWEALAEANGIENANLIYAGKKLKIDPATMGKKKKRKVAIEPPGMHAGERTSRIPTREEAITTNLPMNAGRINIDLPEDYY